MSCKRVLLASISKFSTNHPILTFRSSRMTRICASNG
jgi:hypothetical protein